MTAPNLVSRALGASTRIAIVAVCSLLAACDDGPTGPSTRVVPTLPIPNVSGNWQGTYDGGRGNEFFLCGGEAPATATFSQDGPQVTGTVRSSRLGQTAFAGRVAGSQLSGTLTIRESEVGVTGIASADHVTMNWSNLFCGRNRLDLRRQP